jgi:hypothetical protein
LCAFSKDKVMRLLHVFLGAGLLFVASNTFGQSNFVLLLQDYEIGAGSSFMTANAADFSVSGSPAAIKVSAFGFDCYFAGPNGTNLIVGVYSNSVHYPSNGSSPGFTYITYTATRTVEVFKLRNFTQTLTTKLIDFGLPTQTNAIVQAPAK